MWSVILIAIFGTTFFVYLVYRLRDPTFLIEHPPKEMLVLSIYIPISQTQQYPNFYEVLYRERGWVHVHGEDIVESLIYHQKPVPSLLARYIPRNLGHVEIGNEGIITSIKLDGRV